MFNSKTKTFVTVIYFSSIFSGKWAPVASWKTLYPLGEKISISITNVLVFTCLLFLFALQQHKKKLRRKVKLHKISHRTQKWTGQNDWHLVKIVINNWFSSMWCSCNLYLDTPVASNRCGQYSNHTCHQLKWRKVDSFQCVTLSTEKKKCKKLSVDLRDKIVEKHGQSQGYKSISRDLNVLKIFTEKKILHAYFVSTILIRN